MNQIPAETDGYCEACNAHLHVSTSRTWPKACPRCGARPLVLHCWPKEKR